MKFLIPVLACVALAGPVMAAPENAAAPAGETRYVTDTVWVQLRTGPSSQYRILQTLKTGDRITMLEEDKARGFTRVRSDKGNEGWVLSQFITNTIPRSGANASAEIGARLTETETRLAEVTKEYEAFKTAAAATAAELEQLKALSGNVVAIDDKNKKLTMTNQELEIQVEALRTENQRLREDGKTNFMIYGGGLILVGIFAGMVIPSMRGRQRSSGWV